MWLHRLRALCRRLAAAGHRVVAYDDLSRGRAENLPEGARLIQGDIRDRGRLAEAVSAVRPDAVIHLAAIHYLPDCAARPRETQEVNVEGTRHVLEACRDRVRHVVFASTAAVYASVDVPCSEDRTPVLPIEVYGESKLEGERLVEAFCRETGVAATTVRISNAIGRRETNPHVVPHIFESLRGSNQVPLGSVEARRDYIDTRDIADAILAVHEAAAGYQVFNVGTGVAHSVDEIVGLLGRMLGRRIEIVRDASRLRPVERMLLVADIRKIRRRRVGAARHARGESSGSWRGLRSPFRQRTRSRQCPPEEHTQALSGQRGHQEHSAHQQSGRQIEGQGVSDDGDGPLVDAHVAGCHVDHSHRAAESVDQPTSEKATGHVGKRGVHHRNAMKFDTWRSIDAQKTRSMIGRLADSLTAGSHCDIRG